MGAFASALVGKGMFQAEKLRLVDPPDVMLGADGEKLSEALAVGNLAVYDDIAWQHLAYASGGIAEIERIAEAGKLSAAVLRVAEHRRGVRMGNEALVWEGNRALLQFEQLETLQKGVYDRFPAQFESLSQNLIVPDLASPIPGDRGTFQSVVPGGDIGRFEDRWKWITGSMLPAWKKLDADPKETERLLRRVQW